MTEINTIMKIKSPHKDTHDAIDQNIVLNAIEISIFIY